jgi:predicted nucleotidyltransferase
LTFSTDEPTRSPVALALQRLVLRTGRTRLRSLWVLIYRGVARAAAAYLTHGERDAAVYVRGGVAGGDFLPGLSDIDLIVVLEEDPVGPGHARERVRRRWLRLIRALPPLILLIDGPRIYESEDLADIVGTSAFTYGLDGGRRPPIRPSGYFDGAASLDRVKTLGRPGLYGMSDDWRLLIGPDQRPPEADRDAQLRRIAAWLELAYWWRLAFSVCMRPSRPRSADMCVKFVAEPARIWLWLAHGERASGRAEALRRAARRLPEEESALRAALDLHRSLPDSPPAPLTETLPTLVRLSRRIADLIVDEIGEEDVTEVRLAGADPATLLPAGGEWQPTGSLAEGRVPPLLPLTDWRSLACPPPPDESFALLPGDPGDPATLGTAAATQPAGPYPALRAHCLMILPGPLWLRTRLRAIQCPVTDPVSFALADGIRVARFPEVSGWSAEDTARCAVAEHRAWLQAGRRSREGRGPVEAVGLELGRLLTAARAALFQQSIGEGEAELSLTVTETARVLAARSAAARPVIEEALGSYREFALSRRPPPAATVSATRRLVLELPTYAASSPARR